MEGAQVVDGDREALREPLVELGLHRAERRRGDVVDLGERREEAAFVEVGGREGEGEVIAETQRSGRLIAEPDELARRPRPPLPRSSMLSTPHRRSVSSLDRSTSRISLSSTDVPSIVPRCRAKRTSMSPCSSTISRRRSPPTWFGAKVCSRSSSSTATNGSSPRSDRAKRIASKASGSESASDERDVGVGGGAACRHARRRLRPTTRTLAAVASGSNVALQSATRSAGVT